jgi:hypothetical protein
MGESPTEEVNTGFAISTGFLREGFEKKLQKKSDRARQWIIFYYEDVTKQV